MSELASLAVLVREAIGAAFVLAGLVLIAGGALGMLRFPDFYTRLHAANVSDALGGVTLILGLALSAQSGEMALKLVLLAALLMAASPTMTQLLANAAHAAGLAPLAGTFTAPRPGAAPRDPR
jgi:multicomponent Na+:H+ antiporter subunit G